jgi:hypothetical protein
MTAPPTDGPVRFDVADRLPWSHAGTVPGGAP